MSTLLVGFDSAWTSTKCGSVVGALLRADGTCRELGQPVVCDYPQAERLIVGWQAAQAPSATVVLLDQPTVVTNSAGQRPVENIVASAISLRHGGMQPASTARSEMFGPQAPMWAFLARFGGPADPLAAVLGAQVFETYPALAMISLGWTLPGPRPAGRLPKYNPARSATFSQADWQHVCDRLAGALSERRLPEITQWIKRQGRDPRPRKSDQDCIDACICLLVALHMAEGKDCLMVGNCATGYVVVPDSADLRSELVARCKKTRRVPSEWIRVFRQPRCMVSVDGSRGLPNVVVKPATP